MDGDYRDSDGGPWSECAGCGAIIAYDPDAWDDEGRYHEQVCDECAAEMAADETGEGGQPAMENCTRCERCGASLTADESLSETCNACLDRSVKRTLAGYKRQTRQLAARKPAKRFKRFKRAAGR